MKKIFQKFFYNNDQDKNHLVKGGFSTFSLSLIGKGFSYLFTFLVAFFFGAAGTGIFSFFQSVLQFFSGISLLGLNIMSVRFFAQYSSENKWGFIKDLYLKSLRFSILLSIFFSIILFFSAGFLAENVFHKPHLAFYLQLSSFAILPLVVLGLNADALRGIKKMIWFSFFQNIAIMGISIIFFGIGIFFYNNNRLPEISYVAGISIASILSLIGWFNISKINKYKIETGVKFSKHLNIAFSMFAPSFMQIIRLWAETYLLIRFAGEADLGIFKVALKISTLTSFTLNAILLTIAPQLAELFAKGDMDKLKSIAQHATKLIFWTSFPLLLLFLLFPGFFLGIFGNEFRSGIPALLFLSAGQFINAATGPVNNILTMTGRQNINRNIFLFTTILTVTLDVIFIPVYGAVAAAAISALGSVIFNFIPFIIVKHYYGFYTFDIKKVFSFR